MRKGKIAIERRSPVIPLLSRQIVFDVDGNKISDTITNHITGKTKPTPKRTFSNRE